MKKKCDLEGERGLISQKASEPTLHDGLQLSSGASQLFCSVSAPSSPTLFLHLGAMI